MKDRWPDTESLESLAEAIIGFNADFKISFANEIASQLTGYSVEELGALFFHDLLSGCQQLKNMIAPLDTCPTLKDVRINMHTKSGTVIPAALSLSRINHSNKSGNFFLVILRDRRSETMYNRFLLELDNEVYRHYISSRLAHNINNPLEVIKNFTYILQTEAKSDQQKNYLILIEEEVGRISTHVRNLAEREVNEENTAKRVDLDQFLEEYTSWVTPWAQIRRIRFNLVREQRLSDLPVDHNQMMKIMLFLTISELEHISAEGQLTVMVSQSDLHTCFSFMDTVEDSLNSLDFMSILRSSSQHDKRMVACYKLITALGASFAIEAIEDKGRKISVRFLHQN